MNAETFYRLVGAAESRSDKILVEKGDEYTTHDGNRLGQFFDAAEAKNFEINAAQALLGMADKHYTSINSMSKNPTSYNLKKWREKLDDLRNYTLLLEGVLIDMGVRDE